MADGAPGVPALGRHHMVHLTPAAWAAQLPSLPPALRETVVAHWAARGWPFVVRRQGCAEAVNDVPLGLPLPPALGRHRLSLQVPAAALRASAPPPLLRDCLDVAPAPWAASLRALVALAPQTRCFGSLAWQRLTDLTYLTAASDVDLLWTVTSPAQADALVAQLGELAARAPMAVDGELVTPAGRAVQWREWASAAPTVLVKTLAGVAEVARGEVFA